MKPMVATARLWGVMILKTMAANVWMAMAFDASVFWVAAPCLSTYDGSVKDGFQSTIVERRGRRLT